MNLKLVLALSLAANVLLGLYLLRQMSSTAEPPATAAEVSPPLPARSSPAAAAAPWSEDETGEPAPVRTFTWEMVESPDYRKYIANLRAIGCPEETIRDIIVADVNKLYAAKRREARGEPQKFEYWKPGNPWLEQMDTGYLARVRALEDEKLAVLRQLGIEPDAAMQMNSLMSATDALDTMFGFLPEDKQVKVMQVMQDMQAKIAEAARDGDLDGAAMTAMHREMEAAIRDVLTPEEFRDYELRMSITANHLRAHLGGFDPSEEEFLKVYDLRKAFDDEFSMTARMNESDAERQRREAAEARLRESLKQALGESRYADYERAQDWNFQQIHQVTRRSGLGTEAAIKVHDMKQVAEQEAARVRRDASLAPEQRDTALEGIRAETERSIKTVLGEEGWKQYDRGHNTRWLRRLSPEIGANAPGD